MYKVDGTIVGRLSAVAQNTLTFGGASTAITVNGSQSNVVLTASDEIVLPSADAFDRLNDGDAVLYTNGGGSSVGGLSPGTYYVKKTASPKIQLSAARSPLAAVTLTGVASGSTHNLTGAGTEVAVTNDEQLYSGYIYDTVSKIVPATPTLTTSNDALKSDAAKLTINGKGFDCEF